MVSKRVTSPNDSRSDAGCDTADDNEDGKVENALSVRKSMHLVRVGFRKRDAVYLRDC